MTILLILVTVIISVVAFSNQQVMAKMIFNPYLVLHRKEWYRFITSGFIHADWMHLFFNMYVMYSFGTAVEYYYEGVFPVNSKFYFLN